MKVLKDHIYQLNNAPIWCGCMPVSMDEHTSQTNLSSLYELGVRRIINLTEAIESGPNTLLGQHYRTGLSLLMEKGCEINYHSMPIKDYSIPSVQLMTEIIALIQAYSHGLYIHCMGGAGRTGTVIGCYLKEVCQMTAEEALESLGGYIQATKIHRSPETDEQIDFIRNWK